MAFVYFCKVLSIILYMFLLVFMYVCVVITYYLYMIFQNSVFMLKYFGVHVIYSTMLPCIFSTFQSICTISSRIFWFLIAQ